MVAEFRGSPPHDLGTAVLALARALGENIEISLHLLDDWHRPTAQIVRVEMEPSVARAGGASDSPLRRADGRRPRAASIAGARVSCPSGGPGRRARKCFGRHHPPFP